MAVATATPVNVAGIGQQGNEVFTACWKTDFMTAFHFLEQHAEAYSLHTAGGADEAPIDDLVSEAHGFENLRTLVGLQGRNTHFGHDLEHAFGDAFLVSLDDGCTVGEGVFIQ